MNRGEVNAGQARATRSPLDTKERQHNADPDDTKHLKSIDK